MFLTKAMTRRAFLARVATTVGTLGLAGAIAQCAPAKPAQPTQPPAKATEPAKPAATQPPAPTKAAEKKRITINHISGGSQAGSDKSWLLKEIRAAFPDLEIINQWVSYGSYREKIPVMIASGEVADLQFCNAFNDIPLMMEGDAIQETGPLLEKYGKNILAVTPKLAWESTIYSGKQYAVCHNVYSLNIWLVAYRQDWLTKLGLPIPEKLDECAEAMRAFTKKDPDGNGKADTYGRQLYTTVRFDDDFFHAFGVATGHHLNGFWRKRGDTIQLDWVQPQMKDALGWMALRWKEGVFHPESITVPLGQRLKNWDAGVTGYAYTSFKEMDNSLRTIQGVAPNAKIVAAAPPVGPEGQGFTGEGWPWCYVIGKKCQFPEEPVKIIDFIASPTMITKVMCGGVPGLTEKPFNERGWCVSYSAQEIKDMGKEWTEKTQAAADLGGPGLWHPFYSIEPEILATLPDDAKQHFQNILKGIYSPEAYAGIAIAQKYMKVTEKQRPVPSDRTVWPALQTRFGEFISQAIAGQIDLEQGWKEWLDFFNKNGGPKMTEEANQK